STPDQQVVNKLDVFTVYKYDVKSCMQRISDVMVSQLITSLGLFSDLVLLQTECFSEGALQTKVPYGDKQIAWNEVLDIVFEVNKASEKKAVEDAGRMQPVADFL